MAFERALLVNTVTMEEVTVMFDPEEYSIAYENTFAEMSAPQSQAPIVQFACGKSRSLEMDLLIDTLEEHRTPGGVPINRAGDDARSLTDRLTGFMAIDATTHAPPVLLFSWASLQFQCVMTRCTERVVATKDDGTPLRAHLQVTFSEFVDPSAEARRIKRETADYSKVYVVRGGETLPLLAHEMYGDPRLWRALFVANRLEDPRRLELGTKLIVPRLPYRDPDSGEEWSS